MDEKLALILKKLVEGDFSTIANLIEDSAVTDSILYNTAVLDKLTYTARSTSNSNFKFDFTKVIGG